MELSPRRGAVVSVGASQDIETPSKRRRGGLLAVFPTTVPLAVVWMNLTAPEGNSWMFSTSVALQQVWRGSCQVRVGKDLHKMQYIQTRHRNSRVGLWLYLRGNLVVVLPLVALTWPVHSWPPRHMCPVSQGCS